MMNQYPQNTSVAVRWNTIIRRSEPPALASRISSRMVRIAAHLPADEFIGWQMTVPTKGLVSFASFGSAAVKASDLEWIAEESARTEPTEEKKTTQYAGWSLFELCLPAGHTAKAIGFSASDAAAAEAEEAETAAWPVRFPYQFGEFVRALRLEGAVLRYSVGRATAEEQKSCEKAVLSTWSSREIAPGTYIGLPIRTKSLLLLPENPPVRLLSILEESIPGAQLRYVGTMKEAGCRQLWENPMSEARVLPDIAARIMAMEPMVGSDPILGIASCDCEAKPIPASHANSADPRALCVGKAIDSAGLPRDITVGDADLRRHWQIVGQTGTGKSTLLARIVLSAVESGRGVTLFDPHGATVDVILHALPPKYAHRVRVVHIGDEKNSVPLNPWPGDTPEACEKTISDLNMLFSEIFDPHKQGFLGPRWERWFSIFASGAITLLGKQASFDSIVTLSQNRENMHKLYDAIVKRNPKTAQAIKSEYGCSDSKDFEDLINWCVCKFQRLTAVPQLRNTLGAGANALDFSASVDTDAVTLIDLGVPAIGTSAARIIGTLLLQQLWSAVLARKDRDKTHLVALDEAQLYQTDPLPAMLSEGRKFGVAMILAHQHCGQLTPDVRDALEANSANFSAFRLSVRDSLETADRFDDPRLRADLCRLSAFRTITTLSVDGVQTDAFTMQIEKIPRRGSSDTVAAGIEKQSREQLVEPYRSCRALTSEEVLAYLEKRAANPLPPLKKHRPADQKSVPPLVKQLREIAKEEPSYAEV